MNPSSWQPSANHEALLARADLLMRVRQFFADRGVMEVETPVLSGAGNSDPGLRQWRTRNPETWLRTSAEYAMKRLLAAGSGDIYELGRVFRDEEAGRQHNREFTMLEWYRVGWTHQQLMDEVADLMAYCWRGGALVQKRLSYQALFLEYAQIDPLHADVDSLSARLAEHRVELPGANRRECLDLLLSLVIQPQLSANVMTFVYDFPADQAALARVRPGNPALAERFEMFLGPAELANGYQELTDPAEQQRRFVNENRIRAEAGLPPVPLDEHLLDALRQGLPECAGVALGVDRLLMVMTGATALRDILPFPADRA